MSKRQGRDRQKDALTVPSGEAVFLRDVLEVSGALDSDPPKHGDRWGLWRVDFPRLVLENVETFCEIDLDRTYDAAGILDWIAQLNEKSYLSAKDIGDLVQAIDDLTGLGLQASVCGLAHNRRFALGDHIRQLRDG